MASFTDTTKHVARQAKARQPKLHLDTGAEALRALGFQLGENIKMATGWVPRSLQPRVELESNGGGLHQTLFAQTRAWQYRAMPHSPISLPVTATAPPRRRDSCRRAKTQPARSSNAHAGGSGVCAGREHASWAR